MATITRRDGQQFVVQAYREGLSAIKNTKVIKDIRALAEQHGQFVRVFQKDTGHYEAAFAKEPGFLLGETVRHYFSFVQELVYVEYLPESRQVILVVIRQGHVFIDAKVPLTQFEAELVPALTGEQKYAVHVYGDVPISREKVEGKVYFPEAFIESFETHGESLFGRLPTLPSFQLLPLPYALKSTFVSTQKPWLIASVAAVVVVALLWWLLMPAKNVQVSTGAAPEVVHPYMAYYTAMETPSAASELDHLSGVVDTLFASPGWHMVSICYKPPGFVVLMASDGGGMEALQSFASQQGYQLNFSESGARLSFQDHLQNRKKPKQIYAINPIIETVGDHLDDVIGEKSILVGERVVRGSAVEVHMSVALNDTSPKIITLLAEQLKSMPVALTKVELKMKQGLLTGSIDFTVWGA